MAQGSKTSVDYKKLGNVQFEVSPSLFYLASSSNSDLGFKVKFTRRKKELRLGLFFEGYKSDFYSKEVVTKSFSTVKITKKDILVSRFGIFGEYSPFNFKIFNPYFFGDLGTIMGDFKKEKFPFALSGGIGTELMFQLSSDKYLRPFLEIGYQGVINPIKGLDLDGLKLGVGTIFRF